MNDIELFMALFKKLKNEINNSPKSLTWVSNERPVLHALCYKLHKLYLDISKDISTNNSKHSFTPDGFDKEWKEFKTNYLKHVEDAAKVEKDRIAAENMKLLINGEQKWIENGKTKEEYWALVNKWLSDQKTIGSTFDPLADNPADFMQSIYDFLHDAVSVDYFDDDTYDGAIGAWNFYEKTIGIDYEKIYRRWKNSPELFIPLSIQNKNTNPLIELYNEAVRAYAFGAGMAAVAMCRALMEHILINYYKIKGNNLENIIAFAEKKYPELKRYKMDDKRKISNNVLHDYENTSQIEDKVIVNFLDTIKYMVLNASSKNCI